MDELTYKNSALMPLETTKEAGVSTNTEPATNKSATKKYVLKKSSFINQYKIDYENELNPEQLNAVTHKDGALLVIAGAGSGKTKTLTYRVARLIEDGIKPESILLLTFTKKAADTMLNRATLVLDSRCEKVAGGTFHSFSNFLLRKYSPLLDLKNNFTILGRTDAEDVIAHVSAQIMTAKPQKRFPKKGTILDIYSKTINKNLEATKIIENEFNQFQHCTEKIIDIHKAYVDYKRKNSLLDYDDLLLYLKVLLASNEKLKKQISNTYKYIMIDEYQDTNSLQADIVKLLATEHNNVMAVGDDSQSIYSFRGANFKNILEFPNLFTNVKIIKLEQNYRSSQNILNFTNQVIEKAKEKFSKVLFSNINNDTKPAMICATDSQTEAEFICQKILELLDENYSLNDICVLARSARMTFNLEIELAKRNLPFKKFGGVKFIEAAHIKDVIAHLRFILNPDDIISLNRILLLLKGIGSQSATKLLPLLSGDYTEDKRKLIGVKNANEVSKLMQKVFELRGKNISVQEAVNEIIEYYKPLLKNKYDDYTKREKDLEHFIHLAGQYRGLEQLISDLALEPPDTSVEGIKKGAKPEEYITISTIHSAKGLEWRTVFIIGAVDGRFPSIYSFNSEEEMDEELRLMYVAATRAKRDLYITYPIDMYDYGSNMVLTKPSRFTDGIDSETLERWELEKES